ncbi:MAG: hypothetical protein LBE22_11140 [Azoarcus sp.]|jgi:hypothetical protein|nr:hypothetical protein [Azoarcus sp.]
MDQSGPHLEILLRRLADIPSDFLGEPRIGQNGEVFVAAVVNDLLSRLGERAPLTVLERFQAKKGGADRNRLMLTMIVVWLLADDWFVAARLPQADCVRLLDEVVQELAQASTAKKYVDDSERREELARLVLARLGYRPAGETVTQATDRLSALSINERRRLLEASRVAEARARAIREELVRKQAEASADKWTRE